MDSKRSERFRYIIPGGYLIICLALIFYPKILTDDNSKNFTNIFLLGAGGIVGGLLLNKIATGHVFRFILGLSRTRVVHGKEIINTIICKVIEEENLVGSKTAQDIVDKSGGVFDAFLNEECDDKVINRFFFLCDLEHTFITLSLCSLCITIAGFKQIYEQLFFYGLSGLYQLAIVVYITNLLLFWFFKKNATLLYSESRKYSNILIISQLNKLYFFVKNFTANQCLVNSLNDRSSGKPKSLNEYFKEKDSD